MMLVLAFLFISLVLFNGNNALDNGLALKPPMGFLASGQKYRCNIDCINDPDHCIGEPLFKRMGNIMDREGYREAGYEYVIIDDCWLEKTRNGLGQLQPDQNRFPSGMQYLGDYLHNIGLKLGIYEDIGTETCKKYPGLAGNFDLDAQTFANWGVDYVKIDGCHINVLDMPKAYPEFGKSLNKTGRPIVYSCSWPAYEQVNGILSNYSLISENCNLWRNWFDIEDTWSSLQSVINFYGNDQGRFAPYAGPGHWNDPDVLLVGEPGLTYDQTRVQMALWAVMAAPLLISTDLDTISPEYKAILMNKDIIAINQDSLGIQGLRVYKQYQFDIWVKPLSTSGGLSPFAIATVNYQSEPVEVKMSLQSLGLPAGNYFLWDLYDGNDTTAFDFTNSTDTLDVIVEPTSVVFVKATPQA